MTAETDAKLIEEGRKLFAGEWQFVWASPSIETLPPMASMEVAFAGRSNVGKSSLINALMRHSGMARTSNTPGRTQELNYFLTDDADLYLVDMPGYGFAKAPKAKVEAWTALVRDYLRGRPSLVRVLLLIDSRHGVKANDDEIMRMLDEAAVIYQVVLTKIDKIGEKAVTHVCASTEKALATHPAAYPEVLVTSSAKGTGIAELRAAIASLAADRRVPKG
jgi:GTP-binding protein